MCIPTFKSVYHMCVPPSCLLCGGILGISRWIALDLKNVTLDLRWICAFSGHHFKLRTFCCTDLQAGTCSSVVEALLW